jgi:uncharacterized membrane protein YhaH (DUF805 family)
MQTDCVNEFVSYIEKLGINIQKSSNIKDIDHILIAKKTDFLNHFEIMSIEKVLFTFDGRISRKEFWMKGFLVLAPFEVALVSLTRAGIINPFITLILVFPTIAIYAKRLHDRGLSENYAWLLFSPLVLYITKAHETNTTLSSILYLGVFLGYVWLLIQTWFLKGHESRNKYGVAR